MRWTDLSFTDRAIRQFAGLWIVFFGALAAWQGGIHHQTTIALVLAVVAVTLGPLGLWKPALLRPIYVVWMVGVFPIGWLMSHVILAVLFFGVFTPVALLFRLLGRDALQRRTTAERDSYWQKVPTTDDKRRYFRQY